MPPIGVFSCTNIHIVVDREGVRSRAQESAPHSPGTSTHSVWCGPTVVSRSRSVPWYPAKRRGCVTLVRIPRTRLAATTRFTRWTARCSTTWGCKEPALSCSLTPARSRAQRRCRPSASRRSACSSDACVRACGGGGEDGVCPRQVTVGSVASTQAPPNFIVQTAENGRPFLVLCRTPGMLEMPEGTRAIAWCGPGLVNARVSALWRYTSGLSSTR